MEFERSQKPGPVTTELHVRGGSAGATNSDDRPAARWEPCCFARTCGSCARLRGGAL